MKKFNILTIFPHFFDSCFSYGVISKGIQSGLINVNAVNIRDYAFDKHKMTDDYQYGGGQGLVMKPEPICKAVDSINSTEKSHVVLLDPRGSKFDQLKARELAEKDNITFICGRYEGIDERVRTLAVDEEISIGDFVMSGGELAAAVIIDAVGRLIPGVLGDENSAEEESFSEGFLEFPHYTRPYEYRGLKVPDILRSGDHKKIDEWRQKESIKITLQNRFDLLKDRALDIGDAEIVEKERAKMSAGPRLYVALMHYPMLDKQGDTVSTAITNMDLHDISRSCKTFDVKKYFVVTPLEAQRKIAGRVLTHWRVGYGSTYNANRKEAFSGTVIKNSLLEAISEIEDNEGERPLIIATSAKRYNKTVAYKKIAEMAGKTPVLILFGTGWGFVPDIMDEADYVAEPVEGVGDFNHLSVRSAVAIILDRINKFYRRKHHEECINRISRG